MGLKFLKQGKTDIAILGNFAKISKRKPKGYDREYKVMVPYTFQWRAKLGKVECDCVECLETFMPMYGWDWYHSDECAIIKHFKKYPQMQNFGIYPTLIARA